MAAAANTTRRHSVTVAMAAKVFLDSSAPGRPALCQGRFIHHLYAMAVAAAAAAATTVKTRKGDLVKIKQTAVQNFPRPMIMRASRYTYIVLNVPPDHKRSTIKVPKRLHQPPIESGTTGRRIILIKEDYRVIVFPPGLNTYILFLTTDKSKDSPDLCCHHVCRKYFYFYSQRKQFLVYSKTRQLRIIFN